MHVVWLQELQDDGYDVGKIPEVEGDLIKSVLNDDTARFNSADLNVAYKMDVAEYQRLCPYAEALEENWGKAPGVLLQLIELCFQSDTACFYTRTHACTHIRTHTHLHPLLMKSCYTFPQVHGLDVGSW